MYCNAVANKYIFVDLQNPGLPGSQSLRIVEVQLRLVESKFSSAHVQNKETCGFVLLVKVLKNNNEVFLYLPVLCKRDKLSLICENQISSQAIISLTGKKEITREELHQLVPDNTIHHL